MASLSEDRYWHFLQDARVLKRAAHLVDKDSKSDFEDSFVDRQIFSHYREEIISEIIASLGAERYTPSPATPVLIPKSAYSQRPGHTLPYRDRVVLQAIIMCIAPVLDECLSDSVWSWRVRKGLRGKTPDQMGRRTLFRENDLGDFPFLKRKTVIKYIDEFDPWYALWPKFEEASRSRLVNNDFKYMVFSDISGYFENIQLDLLHHLLLRHEPNAPKTINLLMRHLRTWTGLAHDGSQVQRGIPQGNSVSSFLGNFFLKPVDDYFDDEFDPETTRYFRYMDDIRIVTTTYKAAREAALALETQIRRSKLNLQTAKTHVLPARQALRRIVDRRLNQLEVLRSLANHGMSRDDVLIGLRRVAEDLGDSEGATRIKGSKAPFDGLNLRTLRMWAGMHYHIKSNAPLARIAREVIENPNYKVTRDIQRIARVFPRNRAFPNKLWSQISGEGTEFPYQEAEFLRALRVFSAVPTFGYGRASASALSDETDYYLRLQSVLLLCRYPEDWPLANEIVGACMRCPDLRVVTAGIMASSLAIPAQVAAHLRFASTHASADANRLVQYIRSLRHEDGPRRRLLNYIFSDIDRCESIICDYAAFLRFISTGSLRASRDLISKIIYLRKQKNLSKDMKLFTGFLRFRSEENIRIIESISPEAAI